MPLDLTLNGEPNNKNQVEYPVNIKIFGVGGAGNNAVTSIKNAGISFAELIAINTDRSALGRCNAHRLLQIGARLTNGAGSGGDPQMGESSAEENKQVIKEYLTGADIIFIAAGMGGGTGTGAAPVIARIAKEMGILTVAVVTKPFSFEGEHKMDIANQGLVKLKESCDAMIVILNQKLCEEYGDLDVESAFKKSDDVLRQAILGISDIVLNNQKMNIDLADLKAALRNAGEVHVGIGCGNGQNRVEEALKQAASNKLTDTNINNMSRVILLFKINKSGATKMNELNIAQERIKAMIAPKNTYKFGVTSCDGQKEEMIIILIAADRKTEEEIREMIIPKRDINVVNAIETEVPARTPEQAESQVVQNRVSDFNNGEGGYVSSDDHASFIKKMKRRFGNN